MNMNTNSKAELRRKRLLLDITRYGMPPTIIHPKPDDIRKAGWLHDLKCYINSLTEPQILYNQEGEALGHYLFIDGKSSIQPLDQKDIGWLDKHNLPIATNGGLISYLLPLPLPTIHRSLPSTPTEILEEEKIMEVMLMSNAISFENKRIVDTSHSVNKSIIRSKHYNPIQTTSIDVNDCRIAVWFNDLKCYINNLHDPPILFNNKGEALGHYVYFEGKYSLLQPLDHRDIYWLKQHNLPIVNNSNIFSYNLPIKTPPVLSLPSKNEILLEELLNIPIPAKEISSEENGFRQEEHIRYCPPPKIERIDNNDLRNAHWLEELRCFINYVHEPHILFNSKGEALGHYEYINDVGGTLQELDLDDIAWLRKYKLPVANNGGNFYIRLPFSTQTKPPNINETLLENLLNEIPLEVEKVNNDFPIVKNTLVIFNDEFCESNIVNRDVTNLSKRKSSSYDNIREKSKKEICGNEKYRLQGISIATFTEDSCKALDEFMLKYNPTYPDKTKKAGKITMTKLFYHYCTDGPNTNELKKLRKFATAFQLKYKGKYYWTDNKKIGHIIIYAELITKSI